MRLVFLTLTLFTLSSLAFSQSAKDEITTEAVLGFGNHGYGILDTKFQTINAGIFYGVHDQYSIYGAMDKCFSSPHFDSLGEKIEKLLGLEQGKIDIGPTCRLGIDVRDQFGKTTYVGSDLFINASLKGTWGELNQQGILLGYKVGAGVGGTLATENHDNVTHLQASVGNIHYILKGGIAIRPDVVFPEETLADDIGEIASYVMDVLKMTITVEDYARLIQIPGNIDNLYNSSMIFVLSTEKQINSEGWKINYTLFGGDMPGTFGVKIPTTRHMLTADMKGWGEEGIFYDSKQNVIGFIAKIPVKEFAKNIGEIFR